MMAKSEVAPRHEVELLAPLSKISAPATFSVDQKLEIAHRGADLAEKAMELTRLWMDGKQQKEKWAAENARLLSEMDTIDRRAAAYFRQKEGDVLNEKEQTQRLAMICEVFKHTNQPPELVEKILLQFCKVESGH